MATATKIGPIETTQINNVFYVGGDDGFSSIQEAVNYVKKYNAGLGEIIILHGYPEGEEISELINGMVGMYLSDQRNTKMQNYYWSGAQFSPASFDQLTQIHSGGQMTAYGFEAPDFTASNASMGTGGDVDGNPGWALINAGAPTDQRLWACFAYTDSLIWSSEEDSGMDHYFMRAYRSGAVVNKLVITPPTDVVGVLTSQGSPVRTFANTPDGGGGGGGGGGVNPGSAGQLAFYPASGPLVSGSNLITDGNSLAAAGLVGAYGFQPADLTASHISIGTGGTSSHVPVFNIVNATAPLDQKQWIMAALTDRLVFSATDDTENDYYWMTALRSGHTVTKLTITPPVDVLGVLTAQGSPVRTFANTADAGSTGGANAGSAGQVSFYRATGNMVSPTAMMTDPTTGSTLIVPSDITSQSGNVSSLRAITNTSFLGVDAPNRPGASGDGGHDYVQEPCTSVITGGGSNVGNNWTTTQHGFDTMYQAMRGIVTLRGGTLERTAIGDTACMYYYNWSVGGMGTGADEGCTGYSCHVKEGGDIAKQYFHGSVASTSGTGDQAPVLSWIAGLMPTIDGAFLLNISKKQFAGYFNGDASVVYLDTGSGATATGLHSLPIDTATTGTTALVTSAPAYNSGTVYPKGFVVAVAGTNYVSLKTNNLGNSPPTLGANWAVLPARQLPLCTAIGVVDWSIAPIPTYPYPTPLANHPVDTTIVINLAAETAYQPFVVNDIVSIASNYMPEQSKITAVDTVGLAAHQQRITLAFKYPHAGAPTVITAGGIQGQYLSFNRNILYNGLRTTYYVFGSLTGTDVICAANYCGAISNPLPQQGCEPARSSGPDAGFELYPGAEIVCNLVFNGCQPTLELNGVLWQAGDLVENPRFHNYGGHGFLLDSFCQTPPSSGGGFYGMSLLFSGPGFCGTSAGMQLINGWPATNYSAAGGPVSAPGGIVFSGTFANAIYMANAPAGALLRVQAALVLSSPTVPQTVIEYSYGAGGQLQYDPAGQWNFTSDLSAGTITARGTIAAGAGLSTYSGRMHTNAANDFIQLVFQTGGDGNIQGITAKGLGGFPQDSSMYYDTITIGAPFAAHVFRYAWYGGAPTEVGRFNYLGLLVTGDITTTSNPSSPGAVNAAGGFAVGAAVGVDGTLTVGANTVTVTKGLITAIV